MMPTHFLKYIGFSTKVKRSSANCSFGTIVFVQKVHIDLAAESASK